jgi:hypothetical protein
MHFLPFWEEGMHQREYHSQFRQKSAHWDGKAKSNFIAHKTNIAPIKVFVYDDCSSFITP